MVTAFYMTNSGGFNIWRGIGEKHEGQRRTLTEAPGATLRVSHPVPSPQLPLEEWS